MDKRQIFKRELPKYMERAGMKQIDLAKALGMSKSTVHCWMTGKAFPEIDTIQKIADALGCRTDDLIVERQPGLSIGPLSQQFSPDIIDMLDRRINDSKTAKERLLLSLFATMADSDKEKLLDYAQYIVDSYKRPDKRRPK